jgi:hypothetical protein
MARIHRLLRHLHLALKRVNAAGAAILAIWLAVVAAGLLAGEALLADPGRLPAGWQPAVLLAAAVMLLAIPAVLAPLATTLLGLCVATAHRPARRVLRSAAVALLL